MFLYTTDGSQEYIVYILLQHQLKNIKSTRILIAIVLVFNFFYLKTKAQTNFIPDSITVAIAPEYNQVSKAHRFWLGESYRQLWAVPVKLKVLNFESEKGGLTIIQMGGGLQTKSLRVKDVSGKEWVLRSIQKYPERGLPENLKKTVAKDILQDQVVTGHPFSALVVPVFAAALGVSHSNPQIVYVPDAPALGPYRKDFANSVLLFEERAPIDTLRTDNTQKVQRKLQEDNDNRIDQAVVLRARLLDLLLGDWDRHEDQWRWEKRKTDNETIYWPIPRDRDKVFYNSSGVLPWFLSHQWLKSNIQGFHPETRDIAGYNFNNRYFDRYFLNSLDENDWKEQIEFVQSTVTDSLIAIAMKYLPDTVYKLSGENIVAVLQARRKNLKKEALDYYKFLSQYPDIPGTDKHELFEIKHEDKGYVKLSIYKIKKDHTKDKLIFEREFDPKVTKEVRLYGLAGDDVFSVEGDQKSSIKIRMIGGDGIDSFLVNEKNSNKKRLFIYDHSDQQSGMPSSNKAVIRTSGDSLVNTFDKRNFKYNRTGSLFSIQYNLDQGILIRPGWIIEKQGFRKEPYAFKHEILGSYSTGRKSFAFAYTGDLKKVVGNYDLNINFLSKGPRNVSNFFGLGNETVFDKDNKDISYYRNRYDLVSSDVRLKRNLGKIWSASAGFAAQYYTSASSNNLSKYLNSFNLSYQEEQVFSKRYYMGLVAGIELDTRRRALLPAGGLYWNTEFKVMKQLAKEKVSYGQLYSEFSFYKTLVRKAGIVMTNRIGGGTTAGKPAYFQMLQLGGVHNLRGFHSLRFAGKSMLYHNVDLRIKLFDFSSYIFPGTMGMIGFNDVGRVWMPGEKSNKWHDGFGGGLYLVPADLVLIQALFGRSPEGIQTYISFGVAL